MAKNDNLSRKSHSSLEAVAMNNDTFPSKVAVAPCPFCGTHVVEVVQIDDDSWMVECECCHSTGPIGAGRDLSILQWSIRPLAKFPSQTAP